MKRYVWMQGRAVKREQCVVALEPEQEEALEARGGPEADLAALQVREAVDALPEKQSAVVRLVELEGNTVKDAAEKLQISYRKAWYWHKLAMAALRAKFRRMFDKNLCHFSPAGAY